MTMVIFLPLPELTKVWGTWGCPMCWEPRAFSSAERALCLLRCWSWLLSGDVEHLGVYGTAEPDRCFSCLGITASGWHRPRATQGTRAALPRGKAHPRYFERDIFLSKHAVYNSGQRDKYRRTRTFPSKLTRCSKPCQKPAVLPEIAAVLVDRAPRNPAAGF